MDKLTFMDRLDTVDVLVFLGSALLISVLLVLFVFCQQTTELRAKCVADNKHRPAAEVSIVCAAIK